VDLDYKGLANIGTWFLGRLQTARDRERLLEGLASTSGTFDRKKTEEILSSLDKRVFLMQNVHEDAPVLFQTRWALSYLRGPLTLEQLKKLGASSPEPRARTAESAAEKEEAPVTGGERPGLPSSIVECFLGTESDVYRPRLLSTAQVHYLSSSEGVDHWERIEWLTPLDESSGNPDFGRSSDAPSEVSSQPEPGVRFAELPRAASSPKSYPAWEKTLKEYLYRERRLTLLVSRELGVTSRPGESEADFRARLSHQLREKRDEALEKLRKRFAPEHARLEEAIRRAEARVERESSQFQGRALDTVVDVGLTLAGALFGRKLGSVTNLRRASQTARSATRATQEHADVSRAQEELAELKAKGAQLDAELAEKTSALAEGAALKLDTLTLPPRKSDIRIERLALAWRR
jgi:hypothetical protein